jgi:plastocyanin
MPSPVRMTGRVPVPFTAALAILLAVACSSEGGTNPNPVAGAIAIVSGNNQTATVNALLAQPLVVHVENQTGNDLPGVTVAWSVVAGGGTLGSASSATNAGGLAQVMYALGPNAGANQVRATVSNTTLQVTFTLTAEDPPANLTPASLTITGGDNQTGTAGTELPTALEVEVRNSEDLTLANVTVTWAVTAGGGALATLTGTTNSEGRMANTWTLGDNAGANTATATVQGTNPITVTFNATATPDVEPATIVIVSGNNQTADPDAALADPLVVRVRNALGQDLDNVPIAWTVTAGGGSLGSPTSNTDAQGLASNTYTVGPSGGANTIEAAVQSNTSLNVEFTATATVAGTAVSVQDNAFNPVDATVNAGGGVTWTWTGSNPHNVTWDGGGFTNSGTQNTGTHQVTFPSAGTFTYYCTIHGTPTTGMRGTVTVQ